jgi:hypothetical protein
VHWCIHCRTALAEAEVEYAEHTSPSIYVEFPLAPSSAATLKQRVPALSGEKVSVLIWTTTPWTIPSNLAIAFHPSSTTPPTTWTVAPSSWPRSWRRACRRRSANRLRSRWRG